MKKKFIAAMIVAVVAAFTGYNICQSHNTVALSDLALANVEALANDGETGGFNWPWDWDNGATKDERSITEECNIQISTTTTTGHGSDVNVSCQPGGGINVSMGASNGFSQTTTTATQSKGLKITCWDGGTENCNEVACK